MEAQIPSSAGSRLDSEERFEQLKTLLRKHDVGGLLSVQSVPLVERIFYELLETKERCRTAEGNYEHVRKEYLSAEQQVQPLKEDNARLLHENNALHLELIHEAERDDEQHRQLNAEVDKLRAERSDLLFLNQQYQRQATEQEEKAAQLQKRVSELSDQLRDSATPAHHRVPRMSISRQLPPSSSFGQQSGDESQSREHQDLLGIKDAKIVRLQAAEVELSKLKATLQADLTAVVQKVSLRDQEIERLNKLLDGGQDYQKLSFDHVNRTNQQLVSNLNDQVKFLTSQIVNLENEVLHCQGLHEEAEQQNVIYAAQSKSEQAEIQTQRAQVQELETEAARLRHELAQISAGNRNLEVREKDRDVQLELLAKQNIEAGLREQSLSTVETSADAGSEIEKLRMASEAAAKQVTTADAELKVLRKEILGLNTDLATARRELLRTRRERDGGREEAERLRVAAAESDTVVATLRSASRQTEVALAEADSITSAHRDEVARMSTELLDKDTEIRRLMADRERLETEMRKLRVVEGDVESSQSAAATARQAASVMETSNVRLRQEYERMEALLQLKINELQEAQDHLLVARKDEEEMHRQRDGVSNDLAIKEQQVRHLEKERDRMESVVQTSNTEWTSCKARVRALELENEEMKRSHATRAEENREISGKLAEACQECNDISAALRVAQQETGDLRQERERAVCELRDLHAQTRVLREERDSLAKLYEQLKEQLQVVRLEYASHEVQRGEVEERLRAQIGQLEASINHANVETAEARQRAEISRSTSQQLSTESTVLAKTVSELRQSRADAQSEVDRLTSHVEMLERVSETHSAELTRVQQNAAARQEEVEQMHVLFAHLDATRAELVDTLQRDQTKAANATDELHNLQKCFDELRQELTQKNQALEKATSTIQKLDSERDRMSNQLDESAEVQASLRQMIEKCKKDKQDAERSLSAAEAPLQATAARCDALTSEVEGLRQALERETSVLRGVNDELRLKTDETLALSEDLANLTRENQTINAELVSAISERDQCRQNMAALEARMGCTESQVAMKQAERDELLSAYRQLHDSNSQLLQAAQQAESESEQHRAAYAATQAELVAALGQTSELQAGHAVHGDQVAAFQQQSEEYTRMTKELWDEMAEARASQQAAEERQAAAISLRTASELANKQMQRKLVDLERQRQLAIDDKAKAEQESQSLQYQVDLQQSKVEELETLLSTLRSQASQAADVTATDTDLRATIDALETSKQALSVQLAQAQAQIREIHEPPRSVDLSRICSERDEVKAELSRQTAELHSLRAQLEADRLQGRQDDAYKLQTMQYLRKYEAELQKKERDIADLRSQLISQSRTRADGN